jgi:hypothetical protein
MYEELKSMKTAAMADELQNYLRPWGWELQPWGDSSSTAESFRSSLFLPKLKTAGKLRFCCSARIVALMKTHEFVARDL